MPRRYEWSQTLPHPRAFKRAPQLFDVMVKRRRQSPEDIDLTRSTIATWMSPTPALVHVRRSESPAVQRRRDPSSISDQIVDAPVAIEIHW